VLSTGGVGLTVFTGLTGLIICLIFLLPVVWKSQRAAYATRLVVLADIIISVVWTLFWICSAALLSDGRGVGGFGAAMQPSSALTCPAPALALCPATTRARPPCARTPCAQNCALIVSKSSDGTFKNACNTWRATEAFAYLAVFAWLGYTVLMGTKLWHEYKERRGGELRGPPLLRRPPGLLLGLKPMPPLPTLRQASSR
jgi:hypothetical protein